MLLRLLLASQGQSAHVRKTVELSGRAQNSAKCNLVWGRGGEQSFGRSTDQLNIPKPIRWHKRMCPAQTQIAAQKNSVLEAWRIRKAPTPPPQATTSDKTAFSDQFAHLSNEQRRAT